MWTCAPSGDSSGVGKVRLGTLHFDITILPEMSWSVTSAPCKSCHCGCCMQLGADQACKEQIGYKMVYLLIHVSFCYEVSAQMVTSMAHLEEVLGSSASAAPTDASNILRRSGESEMRRNCTHTHEITTHLLTKIECLACR